MLLNQLPALLGVIVGAAASYLTASRIERSRWQREITTRWDERRLAAYADYMNAVKGVQILASRIVATRGWARAETLDAQEGVPQLAEAEAARAQAFETLVLLGDAETIAKAQVLQRQLWHLESFARSRLQGDSAAWDRAYADYREARADFYSAARRSLGVAGGPVPKASGPQPWQTGQSGVGAA
jgi:hypothetical protein